MEEDFLYSDEELYPDEEEELIEDEGSNRTFTILVIVMGSLLALAICIFAIWAFVVNPRMVANRVDQNHSIELTNEAIMAAAGITSTVEITDTVTTTTNTPIPSVTDTPESEPTEKPTTAAPEPTATEAPETPESTEEATTPEGEEATSTPQEIAEAQTETPTPTATRRVTSTTSPSTGKKGMPETGIGAFGTGILAIGLLFLLALVRRLRQTT